MSDKNIRIKRKTIKTMRASVVAKNMLRDVLMPDNWRRYYEMSEAVGERLRRLGADDELVQAGYLSTIRHHPLVDDNYLMAQGFSPRVVTMCRMVHGLHFNTIEEQVASVCSTADLDLMQLLLAVYTERLEINPLYLWVGWEAELTALTRARHRLIKNLRRRVEQQTGTEPACRVAYEHPSHV